MKKVKCIMLVDDNPHDILFHERAIEKNNAAETIVSENSALEALDYLLSNDPEKVHPDLIFIDFNMPEMSGRDFLKEYSKVDKDLRSPVIVMSSGDLDVAQIAKKHQDRNLISG